MAKRVFTYYVAQTKPYTYILNSMPVMTLIQNPILLIIIWSQTILFHSCLWWPSVVTVLVCTPNINLHIITIAFVKVAQDRYYTDSSLEWIAPHESTFLEFEGLSIYHIAFGHIHVCACRKSMKSCTLTRKWSCLVTLFGSSALLFLACPDSHKSLASWNSFFLSLLFLMLAASQFANLNYKIFSAMMAMHASSPMISVLWLDTMAPSPPIFYLTLFLTPLTQNNKCMRNYILWTKHAITSYFSVGSLSIGNSYITVWTDCKVWCW